MSEIMVDSGDGQVACARIAEQLDRFEVMAQVRTGTTILFFVYHSSSNCQWH